MAKLLELVVVEKDEEEKGGRGPPIRVIPRRPRVGVSLTKLEKGKLDSCSCIASYAE